jgi:hypothetical protein
VRRVNDVVPGIKVLVGSRERNTAKRIREFTLDTQEDALAKDVGF